MSAPRFCDCDRIDEMENPHRHTRDELCEAWTLLGNLVLDLMRERDRALAEGNRSFDEALARAWDEGAIYAGAIKLDGIVSHDNPYRMGGLT